MIALRDSVDGLPSFQGVSMTQTHVRNTAPMQAGNRRRWDAVHAQRAIDTLTRLGWTKSVTAHGLTLTEPATSESVKDDAEA